MEPDNFTTEDFICDASFQNYYLGKDENDIKFWETWILDHAHKNPEINEAKRILAILTANQGNLRQSMDHLKEGIERFDLLKHALTATERPLSGSSVRRRLINYSVVAASLLVVSAGSWLFFFKNDIKKEAPVVISSRTINSGKSPRKTVMLPDGSVVTMHTNSSLTLAGNFNTNNRELTLSGEAFFDVAPRSLPFVVHTADINIEVLGTVFNVSAYPESHTETSLFRGKVSISVNNDPERRITLTPNQKFVFAKEAVEKKLPSDSGLEVVPLSIDPVNHKAKEIAWVRSRLKIEDESLETIGRKLEQWYGIPISFEGDEVKAYRYSGTFENETVVKALEALQLSYPFNFRAEGNRIIISR